MRVQTSSSELAEALIRAGRATPNRASMLVYSAISLIAGKDELLVMGSDGEITIQVKVGAMVDEVGVVLVPGKPLLAWLGAVDDGELTLSDDGSGSLTVELAGQAPYSFRTIEGTFPKAPKVGGEPVRVNMEHLSGAISAIRSAVDRDHKAVQLVSRGGQLRINATDSYRLGQAIIEGAGFGEFTGLVPLSFLDQIGPDVNEVVADGSGRVIEMRSREVTYTTRLISSVAFPAVDSVLSGKPPAKVVLPTSDIRRSLGRLSSVAGSDPVWCNLTEGELVIEVVGSQLGSGKEKVHITNGPKAAFSFGVNPTYLSEALSFKSDSFTLAYTEPRAALFLSFEGEFSVTIAVMPVMPSAG